jgi:hypothetical protein
VDAGLQYKRPRTSVQINLSHSQEDGSLSGAGERTYDEIRGRISRQLSPRVQGAVDAALTSEDLSGFAGSSSEQRLGAEMGWNIGRKLGLWFRLDHSKRDGIVPQGDYSQFGASVYLSYARGSAQP